MKGEKSEMTTWENMFTFCRMAGFDDTNFWLA